MQYEIFDKVANRLIAIPGASGMFYGKNASYLVYLPMIHVHSYGVSRLILLLISGVMY